MFREKRVIEGRGSFRVTKSELADDRACRG